MGTTAAVVLLLLLLKSISNRRSVCVMLGADPLLALPTSTVLPLVIGVLFTVDSTVVFFCLRGLLEAPYSGNNDTIQNRPTI